MMFSCLFGVGSISFTAGSLSFHILFQYCSQGLNLSICKMNGIINFSCCATQTITLLASYLVTVPHSESRINSVISPKVGNYSNYVLLDMCRDVFERSVAMDDRA